MLRANKTSQNHDDVKVLVTGSLLAIAILVLSPSAARFWDQYLAPRPFIVPFIQLERVIGSSEPVIKYLPDARQPVDGWWIAMIKNEDGGRIATRRGHGDYGPASGDPKPWTWSAFFDVESDTVSIPAVPDEPFYVCLRYVVATVDTGVTDRTDTTCSSLFDPNGN